MKVVLSSLFMRRDLALLRFATLYADHIVIPDTYGGSIEPDAEPPAEETAEYVTGRVKEVYHTLPPFLRPRLRPLLDESVLTIHEGDDDTGLDVSPFLDLFESRAASYLTKVRGDGCDIYYPRHEEIALLGMGLSPCLTGDRDPTMGAYTTLVYFYATQAHALIETSLVHKSIPLTDSPILADLLEAYGRLSSDGGFHSSRLRNAALAQISLAETLPGLKKAPLTDILEVRRTMADELEAFRASIARLSATIAAEPWDRNFLADVTHVFDTTIRPTVADLRRQIRTSRRKLVGRVFANLQDPKAYVPLVGGVVTGLPASVALMASMGVATFKALYDAWVEDTSLRQENGLTFLVSPKGPAKTWK